jgi:hypothetical protein
MGGLSERARLLRQVWPWHVLRTQLSLGSNCQANAWASSASPGGALRFANERFRATADIQWLHGSRPSLC